jgi:hypothetical protein
VLGVALLSAISYLATDDGRINNQFNVPKGPDRTEPVRPDRTEHDAGGLDTTPAQRVLDTTPAQRVLDAPPAPLATAPSPTKEPKPSSLDNKTHEPEPSPVAAKTKKLPPSPVAAKTSEIGDFHPLFNGKDLTGWVTRPGMPGRWRVENGILTGSGTAYSALWTVRNDYRDFHLRLEARINESGDSGVFFRLQNSGGSYQVQLVGNPRTHLGGTGSLYSSTGNVIVRVSEPLVSPGQWFMLEVIADRDKIVIKVNGMPAVNFIDPSRPPRSGPLGLEHDQSATLIEFRRIEIRELNSTAGRKQGRR